MTNNKQANEMTEENKEDQEEFRDSIATVTQEGDRIWVYAKKPKGQFYNARTIFSMSCPWQ